MKIIAYFFIKHIVLGVGSVTFLPPTRLLGSTHLRGSGLIDKMLKMDINILSFNSHLLLFRFKIAQKLMIYLQSKVDEIPIILWYATLI